jgi:YesN/AraC family two-component response regulator
MYAKDFHFHENYLSRKIKNVSNKSFHELLIQSRLQEAERLLTNTNLSISEISNKIGYSKPSYFYKLFKEHYNMTPMEYRSKILI